MIETEVKRGRTDGTTQTAQYTQIMGGPHRHHTRIGLFIGKHFEMSQQEKHRCDLISGNDY